MQVAFQQICEGLEAGNASHPLRYEGQTDAERYADMAPYRARTAERFPFVAAIEAGHIARFEKQNKVKAFYSAERLTGLTGLEGRDVKLLMWQLTKDKRFGAMMKAKDAHMLAEMVSDMLAWGEAVRRLTGETGDALHEIVWEVTKSEEFGGDVLRLGDERLGILIQEARDAIAEAAIRRDERA